MASRFHSPSDLHLHSDHSDGTEPPAAVMAAAYRAIFDRFGLTYRAVAADTGAIGGDRSHEFQVIATPGHSSGSVTFYCEAEHVAFTGDTLFAGGPGATGRSFSDFPTIISSIRDHLLTLEHLRSVVGFRGYAQRDPLSEYKTEGFQLFESMLDGLRADVTQQLFEKRSAAAQATAAAEYVQAPAYDTTAAATSARTCAGEIPG